MTRTHYEADVTDPVTGEITVLKAASDAELERLIEEHLGLLLPEVS
ncbi:MAG: hypothetical protein ACRCYU_04130 [Nocardioides sp.]